MKKVVLTCVVLSIFCVASGQHRPDVACCCNKYALTKELCSVVVLVFSPGFFSRFFANILGHCTLAKLNTLIYDVSNKAQEIVFA